MRFVVCFSWVVMKMEHLVISYSRRDYYFAESLFYALSSRGIDAWMDVWKITPGDDWDDDIKQAIQSSQGLILIATRESLQSPNVKDEIFRAYEFQKPVYLVIRGRLSSQDLVITHEYPKGISNTIDLSKSQALRVIIDMRVDFAKGVEKLRAAIVTNAAYYEKLPGSFSFKREKILSIPPAIVFLTLFMVITEFWKFGAGFFYFDQLNQLMSYIRDIIHGAVGEIFFLVPTMIESIISIGSLVVIIQFGFNFSRRKRIAVNSFVQLLICAVVTGFITLFTDVPAVLLEGLYFLSPVGASLKQGESAPSLDKALLLLLVTHLVLFLLISILGIVFWIMYVRDGRGAILRWLPTGYGGGNIRLKGNEAWIKRLPNSKVSQAPRYKSYHIVASPADLSTAQEISALLQQGKYDVTDDPIKAECDIIILSPFADDGPLKEDGKADHPRPVIYVLARSIKKTPPIAIQLIDYRWPATDQFWKQWERDFSQLKGKRPVFPYVPKAFGDSLVPPKYRIGIWVMMGALVVGSTLAIAGMEYLTLVRSPIDSVHFSVSIACLLAAMGLSYYSVAQMLRGVISSRGARRRLVFAGMLTLIAALFTQSPLVILGSMAIIRAIVFLARRVWSSFAAWLPPVSNRPNKRGLLQPISNYKAVTSTAYYSIMVSGFLGLNALMTSAWILPNIPPQSASQPYAVTVPGPYDLATPGLWSQDTFAEAFGYHFDYHSDKLEVSQDQGTGYPTWLKFLGIDSLPMRFAPHFSSSIHVHFTNTDLRTDFGLVLNDFVQLNPGSLLGPQLRLSASGLWMVIEADGSHYGGQLAKNELSQDYTLEVEVNGILCTYTINGKEITVIAEESLSSIQDIMLSFANYVPGGTTYDLSNFTYTPIPGPVLSRDAAIKLVNVLNAAPYTTVAPGWNCNPNDGRWNAGYEPAQQNTHLTCTPKGTQLNQTANGSISLNFDNNAFGELPNAFDYSFDAAFESTSPQCIDVLTFSTATTIGKVYAYIFLICSDGTWIIRYAGYHPDDGSVFLKKQLRAGHTTINKTLTISVQFRSTTQYFYINKQLITSYTASDLMPTILFSNDTGPVLYSNFSYVPRTQ